MYSAQTIIVALLKPPNMIDSNEKERLEVLHKYEILDTPPDGSLNTMTEMAAKIFNVPIAIVSLVDEDRIWFKSAHGLEINQISKDPGLCVSAIVDNEVYVIENAKTDPRALANPLVAGEFGLQFYAAAPLITKDGFKLGTFCIIDKKQRFFSEDHHSVLKGFAKLTMDFMEMRLEARKLVHETLKIQRQ
jgi:GAF domain-containing protein